MSDDRSDPPSRLRWARLRFSIIGPLLASPPPKGELAERIRGLADTDWLHPTTGEPMQYAAKTIESMYYDVRDEADPFTALARKVPKHAGTHPSVSEELEKRIAQQYDAHRGWTYQLHYDNLAAEIEQDVKLGKLPSEAMKDLLALAQVKFPGQAAGVPGAQFPEPLQVDGVSVLPLHAEPQAVPAVG